MNAEAAYPVAEPADPPTGAVNARLVSMAVIRSKICPTYFRPVPGPNTLRIWFKAAKIAAFKVGAPTRRGGGRVYYRAAEVERLFRQRAGI